MSGGARRREGLLRLGLSLVVPLAFLIAGVAARDTVPETWDEQFDQDIGIEALGRRSRPLSAPTLRMGCYEVGQDAREIYLAGEPVELTQKEFELATYMFQHPGKLLSRVHLLEKIWGKNANVDTRTVDTHVSRIRKKLRIAPENGWQIHPVYGYGYRIERLNTPAS